MVEIFTAAKPKHPQPVGRGIVPLLSRVCQEWRAVASDHSPLWATFTFALFDADPSALRWLKIYLERSKAASLTVEVDATKRSGKPVPTLQVLKLIAEHSERLFSLSLVGSHWLAIGLSRFQGRLSSLEVLQLPDLNDESYQQFNVAPRLHTLILQSADIPDGVSIAQVSSVYILRDTSPAGLLNFSNMTSLVSIFAPQTGPCGTLSCPN
ncbi:hypothetical protein B0H19DRAFT_1274203 [Mycena capillaripes]|nr:hypothetical protein B0H19DRAFT_1274203 [Mycena capillaripes]